MAKAKTSEKFELTPETSMDDALKALNDKQITAAEFVKWDNEDRNKPGRNGQVFLKVSVKGAVSVYGLQRMPVTLYPEQWERLLAEKDNITNFIATNKSKLSYKDKK